MRYPLSDTEQYNGKIMFTPIAENYVDAALAVSAAVSSTQGALDQFTTAEGLDAFGGAGRAVRPKKQVNSILANRQSTSGTVVLYLPQAINVADQVSYERIDLGVVGGVAAAALKSGNSLAGSAFKAGQETAKSTMDFMTNRSGMKENLASLAAVRLAATAGSTGQLAARSAFGVTANPNTKSLFRSVELRTFGFSFKMIASSAEEAEAIEQIIKTFRTELYPEAINASDQFFNVPIGYKFPNKYKITMLYNGKNVGINFLNSNLISVQTTYNPSSMGWHVDGKPSEVDMTLAFGEPRTLSKQDIQAGF